MFKLSKKGHAEWVSMDTIGRGDGKKTVFAVPYLDVDPRDVFALVDMNSQTTIYDEPAEDAVSKHDVLIRRAPCADGPIVEFEFAKAPGSETNVIACVVGRGPDASPKPEVAFQVKANSSRVQDVILKGCKPGLLRLMTKGDGDAKDIPHAELVEMSRRSFKEIIVGWYGVVGEDDKPAPCDDAGKDLYLDETDATIMGLMARVWSSRILQRHVTSAGKTSRD